MTVNFGNNESAVEIKTTLVEGGSQAPHPQAALVPTVPHSVAAPVGLVLGDKLPSFDQIILPRLNVVQGTGELKDSFPQGAIVWNQALVLFVPQVVNKATGAIDRSATPPVTLTVLGFRPTRFVEKTKGQVRGMMVDTEDQVRAAGGTLDYREWKAKESVGMKRFESLAEAVTVVERPEAIADDGTVFIYECGGKKYALGLWAMKGTAYTHVAKKVFFTSRAIGCLKSGGYPSYSFSVSTRTEVNEGNSYYVPVALPKEKSSPEFLAFAASILGAPVESAAAE